MHIVHIGGHSSVGQRPSSIGRALVTAIHLDCWTAGLHVVMTMPMMTLAFRISIRWKYMYQDVERV